MPLVLTLSKKEQIQIGDDIIIQFDKETFHGSTSKIRIRITAPRDMKIQRAIDETKVKRQEAEDDEVDEG